jgi:hypothetical protein
MIGNEITWMFVGCGGTFYCATPYLAVLLARYKPKLVITVDPDSLVTTNTERQWANASTPRLGAKVLLARFALGADTWAAQTQTVSERFKGADWDELEGPVVLVVNVDSHEGRLECHKWASTRPGVTAMVVSGCDGNKGQCLWGLYKDGEAIHDWLALHPDTYDLSLDERRGTCGGQTILANAITGQLVGMAVEEAFDAMLWLPEVPDVVGERYWRRESRPGKPLAFRAWDIYVARCFTTEAGEGRESSEATTT